MTEMSEEGSRHLSRTSVISLFSIEKDYHASKLHKKARSLNMARFEIDDGVVTFRFSL